MNKKNSTLPEKYRDASLADVYRDLDAAVRVYLGPSVKYREGSGIKEETTDDGTYITTLIKTPQGQLRCRRRKTIDSSYIVEFPIKSIADFEVMEYVLRNRYYEFDVSVIPQIEQQFGESLGAIFFCYLHTPVQRLILDYMGFPEAHYAMHDYPKETERFLKAVEETDDAFFELAEQVPLDQVNFGDHIHDCFVSPTIFKKWHLPYYQRRNEQLHRKGKFTHCHVDGDAKVLLPLFKESAFDALEALTPLPQGPWTLEEIKEALGDQMILMDGIPATHFLPTTSIEEFERFTYRILDLFAPAGNLVLGISDELPPAGDIERVRLVSKIVSEHRI